MVYKLNDKERKTWKDRYPYCSNVVEELDMVFVYPWTFNNSAGHVADTLQLAVDYLKAVTNLNPTQEFEQRVVIGYRHRDHEGGKRCAPGWRRNWINIPWHYLWKANEPLDACSHELVHPFFACSSLHTKEKPWGGNMGWGEGFCDFLRGPVKSVMGLDGKAWWREMIEAEERNDPGIHWNPAGQFIKMAGDRCLGITSVISFADWFIDRQEKVKEFVTSLFEEFVERPLSSVLRTTSEMEEKYRTKGMI